MGEAKQVTEPAEESLSGSIASARASEREYERVSIFSLSGGVMRPAAKTSNRIDGLLARMIVQPMAGKYVADIDKNLDFLFTSLQLDMINMAVDRSSEDPREPPTPRSEMPTRPEVTLQLGQPFHDDGREG